MTGKFDLRNCYIDKIKIWSRPMSCLLRLVILFFLTVTTLTDLSAEPVGNNAPIMERTMQFIAMHPADFLIPKDLSVETRTGLPMQALAGEAMQVSTFSNPFNGKDLTGWGYLIKKQDSTVFESFDGKTESSDHRYSGQDGIITVHPFIEAGPRYGLLYTKQEYPGDFIFTVEFRASVNADSGIFIRGKQLQCRDYLVAGPYKELKMYKPQDWNLIEIVVKNNVARCTCNGEVLEEAFVLPVTGPIGFESDRGQMEYRNLRVNALTAK
jgi:hypothetical protein